MAVIQRCRRCKGRGKVIATETRTGPHTFTRVWEACGPCNGTGKVVTEPKTVPPAPVVKPE